MDNNLYRVVISTEDQYSIWPAAEATPPNWKDGGYTGQKQECLQYIESRWTDIRPASLLKQLSTAQ